MAHPIRIGNCSGYYGDRLAGMREMLEGGELDVLTGDYLAELTMLILYRSKAKDPTRGYATTFLRQLEDCLGLAAERRVRIVANAGGLNPAGCADAVRELAARLGLPTQVAHVEGDDLLDRRDELGLPADALTANAYLGAWGIAAALDGGADVVVTGRVTDASLVVGPAAAHHGWRRDDWDALAGAVVAGHVLECSGQATGGNYAFFREVPGLEHVGFPLAEVHDDGTSVITKHEGTGGLVSVGTVTAQLLYEIGGPAYFGPDVTTRFDTIELSDDGPDRVRVSGVRGEPPPDTSKVAVNVVGGLRNSMTFLITGLDVEDKATLITHQVLQATGGREAVRDVEIALARTDRDDPATNEQAAAELRIVVKDTDPDKVGRAWSSAVVELVLSTYPGCAITSPPGGATPYGVYRAAYVAATDVHQVVVLPDGSGVAIDPAPHRALSVREHVRAGSGTDNPVREWNGETRRAPLGEIFGARSGDKGGDANLGVWAENDEAYSWLAQELTVDRLHRLLPETAALEVERHPLPNLRAVNFVIHGLLGEGVSSSSRQDPQAKGLGEWLRARVVELPVELHR